MNLLKRYIAIVIALLWATPSMGESILEGIWEPISMFEDGAALPGERLTDLGLVIWNDNYIVRTGESVVRLKVALRPTTDGFGEIDLTPMIGPNRERLFQGVYQYAGDELRVAYAANSETRPNREAIRNKDAASRVQIWKRKSITNQTMKGEYVTNSLGMRFRLILPATYLKGASPKEPARLDEIQHRVTITKPFYIGVMEVTKEHFHQFVSEMKKDNPSWQTDAEKGGAAGMGRKGGYSTVATGENAWDSGAKWSETGFPQGEDHPVVFVSWNDAAAFAVWLSEKEGKNYRLPTEAEWELAVRGTTSTAFFWGDDIEGGSGFGNFADVDYANVYASRDYGVSFSDGYVFTSPVGSFLPNELGLYDMHGNVIEWVSDYWSIPPKRTAVDPFGPTSGQFRVAKGGGWASRPDQVRSAFRFRDAEDRSFAGVGFRLALSVD